MDRLALVDPNAARPDPGVGVISCRYRREPSLSTRFAGRRTDLDLSTEDKEREQGFFPVRLLFSNDTVTRLFAMADKDQAGAFHTMVIKPVTTYTIPAIELNTFTTKSAVATVFEKVNTGGLPLNVFELLTATRSNWCPSRRSR